MPPAYQAIFNDWSPPIPVTAALLITALVYSRGWFAIRRTRRALFTDARLYAFLLGLAVIWISIASPLDGFADALLSAHMIEHLLLMSVVPPLLLLGYPTVPLLRGLPRPVVTRVVGPLLRHRPLRSLGHWLVTPRVAWLLMNLAFLTWHVPFAYDYALEHEHVHKFEHLCFLSTSLLFWWPLIRPWPTTARDSGWRMIPYLVGADLVNTALSAFLAFCDRPVYSFYVSEPNPFGISPLNDQKAGAVIMWVVGSFIFLIPAMLLTYRLLRPQNEKRLQRAPRSA